jgi:hypothetical protein
MKPYSVYATALIIILAALFSCRQSNSQFEIGKIDSNLYSNDYFAFKLQIDTIWHIMNRDELEQEIAQRQALVREKANKDVNISKAAQILLSMTIDTVQNMPQVLFNSLDLTQATIKSEKSFLEGDSRKMVERYEGFNVNISTSEITKEKIGTVDFFSNLITIKADNFVAYQKRYCLKVKDYLFCIMANYQSTEQLEKINKLFAGVKWK